MASSSTSSVLKDSGFFVKNVPTSFDEWDLFEAFSKFGLVGYCRIGGQAVDKNSLFAIVNMISVQDADNVRKALKDGNLQGKGYNLWVSDSKNKSASLPAPVAQHVSKPSFPPTRIPSVWLPLKMEVAVDVVDHLPCSSIAEDVFTLTVKRTDDKTADAVYQELSERLVSYTALSRFYGDVQIGYDCVFKPSSKIVNRARRISQSELYLLDFGAVVKYEPSKCFVLPKVFTLVPTRVSMCALDGLSGNKVAVQTFDRIREVVKQWAIVEKDKMRAQALGFAGPLNMITLYCGDSILAERLERKGVCEYTPRHMRPSHAYTRDELMKFRENQKIPKIDDKDVITDLIVKFGCSVALN